MSAVRISAMFHRQANPRRRLLIALFVVAFLLRGATFHFFVAPQGRYKQPDSNGYHAAARSLALGDGMYLADSRRPIFWRTPGYPLYLSAFYRLCGIGGAEFEQNRTAQEASIWVQIALSSCIPIVLWYLAWTISGSFLIAWLTGWASVFHVGLVLASTFLLTEGIALVLFCLFLLLFYRTLIEASDSQRLSSVVGSALILGAYTWVRPMGQYVALLCGLILFWAPGRSWRRSTKRAACFLALVYVLLMPWYVRNYQWTGDWFFSSTIGPYLTNFSAAKIVRTVDQIPLVDAWREMNRRASIAIKDDYEQRKDRVRAPSPLAAKDAALPLIRQHPWLFARDWLREVSKTTFDLYSYQLVTIANGTFYYDPLEEFLSEKFAAALYDEDVPLPSRAVAWIELALAAVMWIGLIAGSLALVPFRRTLQGGESESGSRLLFVRAHRESRLRFHWVISCLLVAVCIGLTGGFGYARLRLPAEPLLLILALIFWCSVLLPERFAIEGRPDKPASLNTCRLG